MHVRYSPVIDLDVIIHMPSRACAGIELPPPPHPSSRPPRLQPLPPFTPPSQRFVLRCSGFAQPSAAFRLSRRGNSQQAGGETNPAKKLCVFAIFISFHFFSFIFFQSQRIGRGAEVSPAECDSVTQFCTPEFTRRDVQEKRGKRVKNFCLWSERGKKMAMGFTLTGA